MLLASYVLGNRCDSWLSALWHGFALRQHMAGGPSHWRLPAACCLVALAFTWAAMSFFGSPSEPFCGTRFHPCYKLAC